MMRPLPSIGFTHNRLPHAPVLCVLDNDGNERKLSIVFGGSDKTCLDPVDAKGVFLEAIKAELVPYSITQQGSFWRMEAICPNYSIVRTGSKTMVLETI